MRHQAGSLPGSPAGLRPDHAARLSRLEAANPEWRVPLAGLREVLVALGDSAAAARIEVGSEARAEGAPRLDGATLTVERAALEELRARLIEATGAAEPGSTASLLQAGVQEDGAGPIARWALIPVLHFAAGRIEVDTEGWPHGYCPVCAAWPAVAETRGLERARRLRCGRCAADWRGELLRCPFCGERSHDRQGTLAPQAAGLNAAAQTCSSCRGYLKTVTTLTPLSIEELLLLDFETVELDLAARDAGFNRPSGLGTPCGITVALR